MQFHVNHAKHSSEGMPQKDWYDVKIYNTGCSGSSFTYGINLNVIDRYL